MIRIAFRAGGVNTPYHQRANRLNFKRGKQRSRPIRQAGSHSDTERQIMIGTVLLVLLILLLLGALPTWPHSRSWGYYPSGGLGLVVIILLILVLTGRL